MTTPRVNLKNPVLAAALAFLVPGLGHFYQRRIFKGVLYSVCILGTFFTGLSIGHGQTVYFNWQSSENRTYAYLCQFWVGLPALPALAQSQMRASTAFDVNYVPKHFETDFSGKLAGSGDLDGQISGHIHLKPQQPDMPHLWLGELTATLTTAEGPLAIEGQVEPRSLEPEVAPSRERHLVGTFEGNVQGEPGRAVRGTLEGHIPRSLWDSYGAPLRDARLNDFAGEQTDLDRAHLELGSRFELGVVFTMIAGLLNILAIYDALEGPAYDDDEEESQASRPPPDPLPAVT
ncbi:MAG: hypothetical protein EXS05_18280 [Planctomycetaceae bacterium]|nr:hypothetical protein [Planctomycetaceae bacterium]